MQASSACLQPLRKFMLELLHRFDRENGGGRLWHNPLIAEYLKEQYFNRFVELFHKYKILYLELLITRVLC